MLISIWHNMINEKRLLSGIINFVDERAVTTVEEICSQFKISPATFYRIKGKHIVSSVTEKRRYVTTKQRVKKCKDQDGLYTHGNLIFHQKDNINEVIVELIGKSTMGYSAPELEEKLDIQCYRQLDDLMQNKRLKALQIRRERVYFTKRKFKQQLNERLHQRNNRRAQSTQDDLYLEINELTAILDEIQPITKETRARHEYSPLAKFKAICTMFALQLNSYSDLTIQLVTHERIKTACFGNEPRVIDPSTLCRFIGQLTEEDLTSIFVDLVKQCAKHKIISTTYLAVDATHILAWYNTHRDTNKHPIDGATWGRKSPRKPFFGYKLHIIVDCHAELPIAFIISTGKDHDSQHFIPLLEFTKEHYGDLVDAEIFSDSAYWQKGFVEKAKVLLKAELYTAINPRRDRVWKQLKRAVQVFFIQYDRAPTTHEELMAVLGQETLDKYGLELDRRIDAERSRLMRAVRERLNRQHRAAVERVFSRLKRYFGLNSLRSQHYPSVKKHILFSMITMLVMALAMKNRGIPPPQRRFVKIC